MFHDVLWRGATFFRSFSSCGGARLKLVRCPRTMKLFAVAAVALLATSAQARVAAAPAPV
jgi:hypothetical protein